MLVTNLFPVPADPSRGIFVARQMEAVNRLLATPVEVVVVGNTGAGNLRRSRRAVRAALARAQPDVVHVYYGLSGAALPLWDRTPRVLSLCGSDVLQWPVARSARGLLEYLISVTTARRAAVILAQSESVRTALPTRSLRGRVRIQATGIDLVHFRPEAREACRRLLGWSRDEIVLLFPASSRRAVKRFGLACDVVQLLNKRGGTSVQLRTLGNVRPDDVPLHLNAADAVLVTSRWEAGPIATTEALACGVPVVSVPVGYAADPGLRSRWLRVAAASPEALAGALRDVLTTPLPHERPADMVFPTSDEYALALLSAYDRAAQGDTPMTDMKGAVPS